MTNSEQTISMGTAKDAALDVSVITVTYHAAEFIGECLASVRAQQGVTSEIIVVDNASKDRTVQVVRELGGDIRLIENKDNVGFGRGCNQGFAISRGRFVFLLNPDARLVGENALALLCRALEAHPGWGMAGTRLLSPQGTVFPPNTDYPGQERARNNFDSLPGSISWVMGASMFIRRGVYDALGGFDPGFFLYAEETDFCLRLRQLGHEIGYVDSVEVRHIGGASECQRDPCEVWTQRMRGLYRFWSKHYLPEDVVRLVRWDRLRSLRRIAGFGLWSLVSPRPSPAWQNFRRWLAVWRTASEFLAK
jgi:hypothetical protein